MQNNIKKQNVFTHSTSMFNYIKVLKGNVEFSYGMGRKGAGPIRKNAIPPK